MITNRYNRRPTCVGCRKPYEAYTKSARGKVVLAPRCIPCDTSKEITMPPDAADTVTLGQLYRHMREEWSK